MKTINYSVMALLSVLFCAFLTSCSEEYSSPLKGQTVDDVIVEPISFGSISKTITIGKDDLSKCSITSSAAWCSATIQVSSVIINVQPNDTYGERQATITLTDPEDATILSFKVIQKQNDAILVDGDSFSIPEEGGTVSIKVQSNVSYNVEIPATATWLTKSTSSTRGLTSSTIVLRADKNNSGDEREAIVKLTDSTSGTSSQFTVKQELTPVVTIDYEQLEIDELGGEVEITVNSNIELNTDFDDNWVTDGGKTQKGDFGFIQKLVVSPLTGSESSRSTFVSFTPKNNKWDIIKSVKITQTKSLSIKDSNVDLLEGKSYSLNFVNNTGKSISWKSSNTSVATVNSSGKVTGVSKGSATITVTTADGKYSDQCTVTVKDITDFIVAKPGGGSIMMVNNLIQYGSSLGWFFSNTSSEKVTLKSLQLVDGANGKEGNIMSVDQDVPGGTSVSYSVTIGLLGIHTPVTCRFRYEYNGREYMTTAVYEQSWPFGL